MRIVIKVVYSVVTEEEKRVHRCCFTGQRPEKLSEDPETIKDWLTQQIKAAISAGYTTFISGCAMGVDIWAAQIVIHIREEQKVKQGNSNLHLIAATPWPGFSNKWSIDWKQQYSDLLKNADLIIPVCNHYHKGVFQQRNEWMVDHSNRVIAYYNGAPGGTKNTIDYAQKKQIEVVTNNPNYVEVPKVIEERKASSKADKLPYPENLITDLGLEAVCGGNEYKPLNDDQMQGLQYALQQLRPREQEAIKARYENQGTLQVVGEQFGVTRERARQIILKALRKLKNPLRLDFIRDGYEAGQLKKKLKCAEDIKRYLAQHLKKHPLATEEDVVKFVFQGMLGVGHLVTSHQQTLGYIISEMNSIEADEKEPLTEKLSTFWVRLNLRAAKARDMNPTSVEIMVYSSAKYKPVSFTRQNVYNFCMKLEGFDRAKMQAVAEKVLDENWLPSHSESYRNAYHPAYRVVYTDFKKLAEEEEEENE